MLDADFFELNGFQIIDNFLTAEQTLRLSEYVEQLYQSNALKKAGIGKQETFEVNNNLRGDFIQWINEEHYTPDVSAFLEKLEQLKLELNRNFYLGIKDFESHFTRYPEGTRYVAHSDRHSKGSARVVSFVFYLNENWKTEDGGVLRVYESDDVYTDIEPRFGRLAIFLSDKIHEVLTTNRTRRSITGWLLNEIKLI